MVARSIGNKLEDSEAVPNENQVASTTSAAALEGASTGKEHSHWIKKESAEESLHRSSVDDETVKTSKQITRALIATKTSKKSSRGAAEVEDETIVADKKTSSRKQQGKKLEIEPEDIADPVLKDYKTKSKATKNVKRRFTPIRRAEIVKLYIENSRSVVLTQRAYRRKYSVEHPPSDNTIRRLVSNFVKHGTVEDRQHAVHQRPTRSNDLVEAVRKNVAENPYVSYRQRAQLFGISGTTMRRILKDDLHVLNDPDKV